jgi:hypothetical protein
MTRAEKASIAYQLVAHGPRVMGGDAVLSDDDFKFWNINYDFVAGYEQAKKDLSLTIEDIELLHTFLYAVKNNKQGMFTFTRLSDEQYKEVLRRFKAIKEGQK